MTLNNTSQVTEAIKATVPPEKLSQKLRRLAVALPLAGLGIYIVIASVKSGSPSIILVCIGIGLVMFAANIVSSDLTRAAGKYTVAFIKDLIGALGGLVKKGDA